MLPASSTSTGQVCAWVSLIRVSCLLHHWLAPNDTGFNTVKKLGVDYRHPALGGCFGTGCRIAYGYDLVGDDYDGSPDSIRPDADPLDDCPAGAGK